MPACTKSIGEPQTRAGPDHVVVQSIISISVRMSVTRPVHDAVGLVMVHNGSGVVAFRAILKGLSAVITAVHNHALSRLAAMDYPRIKATNTDVFSGPSALTGLVQCPAAGTPGGSVNCRRAAILRAAPALSTTAQIPRICRIHASLRRRRTRSRCGSCGGIGSGALPVYPRGRGRRRTISCACIVNHTPGYLRRRSGTHSRARTLG
jgi:hypothetical protein